jgi:hypothetical protein
MCKCNVKLFISKEEEEVKCNIMTELFTTSYHVCKDIGQFTYSVLEFSCLAFAFGMRVKEGCNVMGSYKYILEEVLLLLLMLCRMFY